MVTRYRTSIVVADLNPNGLTLNALLTPGASALEKRKSLCLKLPAELDSSSASNRESGNHIVGSLSKAVIEQTLIDLSESVLAVAELSFSDCIVVIGHRHDPFHPYPGKFDSALRLIEAIVGRSPKLLALQTRSPLAVLAAPLLHSAREKTVVTIAVESIDEKYCSQHTPNLPRPEERLHTCRTLKGVGINTILQACPPAVEKNLARYVATVADAATYLYPTERLELSRGLRPGTASPSLTRFRAMFDAVSAQRKTDSISVDSLETAWASHLSPVSDSASIAA